MMKLFGSGAPKFRGMAFGDITLPPKLCMQGTMYVGAPGSGKTVLMRRAMQDCLPSITPGSDRRAAVFDSKQDVLSILGGMDIQVPIHVLNPSDLRSSAWDMAKDLKRPTDIESAISILHPLNPQASQPFFDQQVQVWGIAVLSSFNQFSPGEWTLRDYVIAMSSERNLRLVLKRSQEGRDVLAQCFGAKETVANVMMTVANRVQPYRTIAALWDHAEKNVSLDEWARSSSIIVMGNSHRYRPTQRALNQVIYKRITDIVLDEDETRRPRHFIFTDELRQAGRIDGLQDLLLEGRSKGCVTVIGFQDHAGMHDVWGPNLAEEICGIVANICVLRVQSTKTAQWASDLAGQEEIIEEWPSYSVELDDLMPYPKSMNVGPKREVRSVLLPSDFLSIPQTSLENGLTGVFFAPGLLWQSTIPGRQLFGKMLWPEDPTVSNFEPRPPEHERLRPWDADDFRRLRLVPDEPVVTQSNEQTDGGTTPTQDGQAAPHRFRINPEWTRSR